MKETYSFNFRNTANTNNFEKIAKFFATLNPEKMTSGELAEFCKMDRILSEIKDEIYHQANADSMMLFAIAEENREAQE